MKKYLLIALLLQPISIYPQFYLNEPAPLQPGNYWLFSYYEGGYTSLRVLDSAVSIGPNSYYIVEDAVPNHPEFGKYYHYNRIDSNSFYVRFGDSLFRDSLVIYYKQGAAIYDSWENIFSMRSPSTAYYSITDTGTIIWNGIKTKFKE